MLILPITLFYIRMLILPITLFHTLTTLTLFSSITPYVHYNCYRIRPTENTIPDKIYCIYSHLIAIF